MLNFQGMLIAISVCYASLDAGSIVSIILRSLSFAGHSV